MTIRPIMNPFTRELQLISEDSSINPAVIEAIENDIINTAFRIAIVGDYTEFDMSGKTIDEYEDQSDIDLVNSDNIFYVASEECYQPYNDFDRVSLLLHNNGVEGSQIFTDEIGKAITAHGNAQIKTDRYKFGGASARFYSAGDYLSIPASSDFNIGTGEDFTIDFWMNLPASIAYHTVLWCGDGVNNTLHIFYNHIAPQKLELDIQYNGIWVVGLFSIYLGSIVVDTWNHFAIVRSGNTIKIYVNGTNANSADITGKTFPNLSSLPVQIGDVSGSSNFRGWIDELRWSKGIARWTSDFTPPSLEYVGVVTDMSLLSNAKIISTAPSTMGLVLRVEEIDSLILNTDLIAEVSRDNGVTWTPISLALVQSFDNNSIIINGTTSVSGQPSGTQLKYRISSVNNKNFKLHGTARLWS